MYNSSTKKAAQQHIKEVCGRLLYKTTNRIQKCLDQHFPLIEQTKRGRPKLKHTLDTNCNNPGAQSIAELLDKLEQEMKVQLSAPQRNELQDLLGQCTAKSGSKSAREALVRKMAKAFHKLRYKDYVSIEAYNKNHALQVLESCTKILSSPGPSVVLIASSSYLWDIRFSKDRKQAQIFDAMNQLAEHKASRYQVPVVP